MKDIKQKNFKIDSELAIEFEIHAKRMQTSELELIHRYIKNGIEQDKLDNKS